MRRHVWPATAMPRRIVLELRGGSAEFMADALLSRRAHSLSLSSKIATMTSLGFSARFVLRPFCNTTEKLVLNHGAGVKIERLVSVFGLSL